LWSAKVLYGLLHFDVKPWDFETRSWLPPRQPASLFDHLQLTIRLLNGFRQRIIRDTPKWPFSILRFHLKSGAQPALNFNFRTSIAWPSAPAVRVDSVGFIVVFEDFGYVEHWYDKVLRQLLDGKLIHPLQFSEIVARTFYQAGMVQFNVKYRASSSAAGEIISLRPESGPSLPPNDRQRAAMISVTQVCRWRRFGMSENRASAVCWSARTVSSRIFRSRKTRRTASSRSLEAPSGVGAKPLGASGSTSKSFRTFRSRMASM
jgi:hypothetical protein